MEITLLILFLISFIAFAIRTLIRTIKVEEFRMKLIKMCDKYNRTHNTILNKDSAYNWFLDKHTATQMIWSRKELTIDQWFTQEELKKIGY